MKFFTPELYLKLNSSDDKVVEEAHDKWEQALIDYKNHLHDISKFSEPIRKCAETLCLHDARFLNRPWPLEGEIVNLALEHQSKFIFLIYCLAERPLCQIVNQRWPFKNGSDYVWLYDEFDVTDQGILQHEILISSGHLMTIKFYEMFKHERQIG